MVSLVDLEKPPLNELCHFGIPGMRWGHHKPEESTSVKNARAKLELAKANEKAKVHAYYKKTGYGLIPDYGAQERVRIAGNKTKFAKEDLVSAKILDKVNSKPKSKTQLKLEEKYKGEGYNADESAVMAYKNIRTRKIVAVAAGVTLAAAAGYAGYKIHDANTDKLIKAGTTLQHLTPDQTKPIFDGFYSTENAADKSRYKGFFVDHLRNREGKTDLPVYNKSISVLTDIKQASYKNAKSTFEELRKNDPEFAKLAKKKIGEYAMTYPTKMTSDYDLFNLAIVDSSPEMKTASKKFYEALSSKGYNAIRDLNDSKLNGVHAKNPLITFATSGKIKEISVEALTDNEVNTARKKLMTSNTVKALAKTGAEVTTLLLGTKVAKTSSDNAKQRMVIQEYREEHPDTKLTNTQIIRNM